MRISHVFIAALFTLFLGVGNAAADDPTVVVTAKLNTPVITVHGGNVILHLGLRSPRFHDHARLPLNLSVVLDRSGSMGDEKKIDYARRALHRLIDGLTGADQFSLVIYDDVVEVLARPQRVSNKARLHEMVDNITPGGSTNLGGGMMEGLRLARGSSGRGRINRVILLSDGLANQGITSPVELNRIAREYRNGGVSLTTMGLGLDYNENLMVGLAEHGGGNYYFIEHPNQMAHILGREFDMMSSIVCRNAEIELRVHSGTKVKDVIGSTWTQTGDVVKVQLGDLMNDEQRELTVELEVPKGSGSATIAEGVLGFESDKVAKPSRSFAATIQYVDDPRLVEQNRDMDIQGKAEVAISTRSVERAMEALDEGRAEDAVHELKAAQQGLSASPAASAAGAGGQALRAQMQRLDSFKDSIATGDARKAKKDIQYQNYQIQKNKQ